MSTYRMELSATVCFDVRANSEEEATTLAEKAAEDFSFGFELPEGKSYRNAVVYTSQEDSADVLDEITDRWEPWQLAPDSDPEQRWILVNADDHGQEHPAGTIYETEEAAAASAAQL